MENTQKDYQKLQEISRYAKTLAGVASLLEWDHETYMPPGASEIRGEQLKALAGLIHKEKTSNKFAKALGKLIHLETGKLTGKGLKNEQKAALREWRRDFLKDTALPQKFVKEFAKLTSESQSVWRNAKQKNDFSLFTPSLEKIVAMCRKKADYLGYQDHPYDALLDLYEPEATTREIGKEFADLKQGIVSLLKKIKGSKQIDDSFLYGKFPHDKQLAFGKKILDAMGYDAAKGRLDLSTHPFSSSCHPTDSRITTRIHPTSLMSNISVILHEGGHSLYEMGLPQEHYGSPLGEAISLGVHESQSRWWETRIGQSQAFWQYYLPLLQSEFKNELSKDISLKKFYNALNKVEPSFIRVEADEVTYPLHVILRFELETALIAGSLRVKDVPEAWNEKMHELLGITPSSNAEGCLQDVHWSMGGFGYFPTYTLGNMYAAHLFLPFEQQHPDWQKRVATGELGFIKDWLAENVYQHGRCFTSKELLKRASGKPFSAVAYIDYLNKKYSDIYQLL
jgi:carboxypeptidase Taq